MSFVDSVKPMFKLVYTAVGTGSGSLMGMAGTKTLHSLLGSSLAAFSYLQGLGVQSNEKKEAKLEGKHVQPMPPQYQPIDKEGHDLKPAGGNEEGQLGEKIMARAQRVGLQDVLDLAKACATVAAAAVPMFAMDYLGGSYMQEEIAKSFSLPAAGNLSALTALPAVVLCTVADAVVGMAMVKTVQAVTSVTLAKLSYVQALGISSNEEKEQAKERIGDNLSKRALRTFYRDLGDIAKAAGVLAVGTGLLYVGSYFGGQSIQVSALNAFRKSWNIVK